MNDDFEYFLEKMGPAHDKRVVPASSIERYRGKLPKQLLADWAEHGWSGYGDGLFWTVNPEDYQPVLEAWIGDTRFAKQDVYHVIARGAFGSLHLWGETTGDSLFISPPNSYCIVSGSIPVFAKVKSRAQFFFWSMPRQLNDFDDMFKPAIKKLGHLKHDEVYGFVPAPALGGACTVKNLKIVKAVEHLVMLAQFAQMDVMTLPPL
jgi:hypothetical protein